jgi:hypothetical protein
MSQLTLLLPSEHEITVHDLATRIETAKRNPIGIGSEGALSFCKHLSTLLLEDRRALTFPSLQALGFWLRPASIKTLLQKYTPCPSQTCRVPRGVVFQIPPSNIETLFGYNCALSLLCGNTTIVRLPSQSKPEQETLLDFIAETLGKQDDDVSSRLLFVKYAHNESITSGLSSLCDLRMVWGGDETINALRKIPLPPLAHEISFANRFSMAAIHARRFLEQDETSQTSIARDFVNDVFQFNQMACSSPRLIVWIGNEEDKNEASNLFYPKLASFALEKYGSPEPCDNVAKVNTAFLALHDLDVSDKKTLNPSLTILSLKSWDGLQSFKRISFGNGFLLEQRLEAINALADLTESVDQTLAFWGFEEHELKTFISRCSGRGFDRLVRFGDALAFDPVWDGTNLFDVLTKFVKVVL